jgi:TonB family protein
VLAVLSAVALARTPAAHAQMASPLGGIDTVRADSGMITVTKLRRASGLVQVVVCTPEGSFPVVFNETRAQALADRIRAAGAGAWVATPTGDTVLNGPAVVRFRRLSPDSTSSYELRATNGAWDGHLMVSGDAARQLLASLDAPPDYWQSTGPLVPDSERMPVPLSGLYPRYPHELLRSHLGGRVVMGFTIDSTGRVSPRSMWLVRSPNRLMSLAVREWLLNFQFAPARVDGRPVQQTVTQWFDFSIRR